MMNLRVVLLKIKEKDNQLKDDHDASEKEHMYMIIKMSDVFGFINDLAETIHSL